MTNTVLFIDTLGSGGAQRQLINLAVWLKDNGFSVHVLYYNNDTFFEKYLLRKGIKPVKLSRKPFKSLSLIFSFIAYIYTHKISQVVAFCTMPSFYSEIARVLSLFRFSLIVSERNSSHYDTNKFLKITTSFTSRKIGRFFISCC